MLDRRVLDQFAELANRAGASCAVRFTEPLALHTTLRVGGPADVFVEPYNLDQLRQTVALARAHAQAVTVIGGGSNLLVTDAGVRGVVIRLGSEFATIEFTNRRATVGAATSLNKLVRQCARRGLAGLEFAIGIPGVVGGAVFGNAGACGGEVGACAESLRCVNECGDLRELTAREAGFKYRHSGLSRQVVVGAGFALTPSPAAELEARIRDLLARRKATQPVDKLNAGCIFKNTARGAAGQLIDRMGGKGMRVGAAVVSELHANFIINEGGATASEVLELIACVRHRFAETYGFEIRPEIRVVGEGAPSWNGEGEADE